ncbi:aminoacyl-histidine dipeptidase [Anaeromyxobacter diazotrophicus]|uniref:Cytosol non-specific dipeptidase n=1 Tax=Anaeromyxobacter diazotrophicus TaxID=2590199 RepID=A0A7I9VP09_9BACT|nr:aminoacyl-histidine dipeptidase [Anaeromyxobacter diazotrophicus]GEJ58145.1 aminoacyl-histidine dipeptidase [Anaeromyxobacter diazotrophicus]
MSDLADLEPRPLWRYFLELSRIPRGSRNEAAAMRWVAEQGRALGCAVEQDAVGNVLLRKAAARGGEGRAPVALQVHADMVCEKNEGTPHDFERDGIDVVRDGEVVRARGTTLGADDGIGVAAALAALADPELRHGPLEVLVTVDEETGLTGANAVRPGWLAAKVLLNLDSEEEGELTIGCAGGVDTVATRRVTRAAPAAGSVPLRVKVSGLRGGHSGTDIAAGRGNALRVLGQVLAALAAGGGCELASVRGGNKRNAIAREASAVLQVAPGRAAAVREEVARQEAAWRAALGAFDPGLSVAVEPGSAGPVLSPADAQAVVGLLLAGPHGVEAMSPDIPGLVQTSTNFGVFETRDDAVEANFLTRSSVDASKSALAARIAGVCALAGFETHTTGGYPGWKPEPGAPVVKLVDGVHRELFGKPMVVRAIHAGLECGLIGEKYPGLQMVSFGPTMWDAHTPDERVSIASVQNFWRLLRAVLERV